MNGSTAQMTPLEERLTAALAARAHQVDESDLAPGEVPEPQHRNRGLIVLAAAACTALVIGVPYGIAQLDGSEKPTPPATSTSPTPGTGEGADWPVQSVGRIDLDGDGTEDVVQLRIDPTVTLNPMGYVRARVEVALPAGVVYTLLGDGAEYHLEGAVDLPGSPGQEQLVSIGTSLRVLDLVDGELKVLDAPDDPPLMRRNDSQGRTVTWFSTSRGLFSIRSIEPVGADVPRYAVERWRWRVSAATLMADEDGSGCVDSANPSAMGPCEPGIPVSFTPDRVAKADIGDQVEMNFSYQGDPVLARLVMDPFRAGDFVTDGEVTLVVTAGERTWKVDLPAGGGPVLWREPGITSAGFTLIVSRLGVEADSLQVFAFVEGDLVELEQGDGPPLTTTDLAYPYEGGQVRTWMQDGWLYTAVEVGEGDAQRVYRWNQDGETLRPTYLGMFCVNLENPENPC